MRADSRIGSSVVTYRSVVRGGNASRNLMSATKGALFVTALIAAALIAAGFMAVGGADNGRMIGATALYGGALILAYSLFFWYVLKRDTDRNYTLVLSPDEVILRSDATARGAASEQRMALSDIDHVEWFTPRDSEKMTFFGRDGRVIECPLWHMDRAGGDAIAFLRARNIEVLQV